MRSTKDLTLAALFLAIGFFLPYITAQIQVIGQMLLPMHIPVILCGLVCGWKWGLTVGILTPLLRSLLTGMPPFYPMAIAMMAELGTYGLVAGLFYEKSKWKCVFSVFKALILAMICGRIVYGIVMVILLGATGSAYSWSAFISSTILTGIPGIILQLILIPLIMMGLNKAGVVQFTHERKTA